MGANAQTAVPVFTAGQVLTAQQQTEINTGIPVFATTVTRDAAFGGAGEKTLAEGQFAYIEATNTTQYYDGAAWQSVGGLTLITSGSFSAVTTFTVDNVFTSTYRNYRILVHDTQVTGASAQVIETKLRVGGVASATTYYSARSGYQYTGSIAADVVNNGTHWFIQRANGSGSTDGEGACSFDLFGPALAANTFFNGTAVDGSYQAACAGYHNTATAYDGISFTLTTGATTMTGIYRIYGYQD
jgi:hypothetical protein